MSLIERAIDSFGDDPDLGNVVVLQPRIASPGVPATNEPVAAPQAPVAQPADLAAAPQGTGAAQARVAAPAPANPATGGPATAPVPDIANPGPQAFVPPGVPATELPAGEESKPAPEPGLAQAPAQATATAEAIAEPAMAVAAAAPTGRSSQELARRLASLGWWIALLALLPLGAWMSLAPLSMAVVAPAFIKVDLNRRPVQHLEGGIVREVLVRDGQRVKAGQPILILGDVGVDAERNRLDYRVLIERASLERLEAEQQMAKALDFPPDLKQAGQKDPRVAQALLKETGLFKARRESLMSEVGLMKTQRENITEEMTALRSQIAQAQISLALQRKDLESNRALLKDGFIPVSKVVQLESTVVDYAARLDERRSELARAAQRMVDNDLKVKSVQNQYVQEASDQLKITAARLAEIEQEQRKTQDAAERQVVTAPTSGEVIDLKFTSPGAVVRPGDPIADIVPHDAKLMVEAHIRPEDISHVRQDQYARVKLTAYKHLSNSTVMGKVSYVSADRLVDKATNLPYYSVTIQADPDALAAAGQLKLQAGMPAEVYIEGTKQTALQYLVEPVSSVLRKAAREM